MKRTWIWALFSAVGELSSKRVVGAVMMAVALICAIILVITEGGSDTVESLLQTIIIVAAGLLGISSITGIWKNGNINIDNHKNQKTDTDKNTDKHEVKE